MKTEKEIRSVIKHLETDYDNYTLKININQADAELLLPAYLDAQAIYSLKWVIGEEDLF